MLISKMIVFTQILFIIMVDNILVFLLVNNFFMLSLIKRFFPVFIALLNIFFDRVNY